MGYITANIEYSNCLDKYKEKSFFRILDEITAFIKSIKNELGKKGFDESKLELALYGISAGGQIILLYLFTDKNKILPIKFIVSAVGVASIDSDDWYTVAVPNVTLDNIENLKDIENAINNGTLVQFGSEFPLKMTNLMTGKKLIQEELDKLIINGKVNKEDPKYQNMYKYAKYGSPIHLVGNCTIPILGLYCGNDGLFVQFAHIRQAYIDNGLGDKIKTEYMKYAGHERFHHGMEHDIKVMKEMHLKILEFAQTYFTSDKD